MDAKSFCSFLKEQIAKDVQVYNNQLLDAAYATIEDSKRAGGIRYALTCIMDNLDKILADFYTNNNVTLPTPVPPVDASQEG